MCICEDMCFTPPRPRSYLILNTPELILSNRGLFTVPQLERGSSSARTRLIIGLTTTMSESSIIELTHDTAGIPIEVSTQMELVVNWTKVNGLGKIKVRLNSTDSVCLWYHKSDPGVEINKHFIELHITKRGSEDMSVFVESFHKPVVCIGECRDTDGTGGTPDQGYRFRESQVST